MSHPLDTVSVVDMIESRVLAVVDASAGVPDGTLRRFGRDTLGWAADGDVVTVRFEEDAVETRRVNAPRPVADIARDGSRVLLLTDDDLTETTMDGSVRWRVAFPPTGPRPWSGTPSAVYDPAGGHVWLYRPDAAADRDERDVVLLLDADGGDILATERIDTAGHGAQILTHPDGSLLMDVGEGQDGVTIRRLRRDGDGIDVRDFGWVDRCLIDVSASGTTFLTIAHDQTDAILHSHPDGAPLRRFAAVDLAAAVGLESDDEDGPWFEWDGGFFDASTLALRFVDTDDDEHGAMIVLDTDGGVVGLLPESVVLLGDGTWLDRDGDGRLVRYTRA